MSALTKPILRSQVPGDTVPIPQGYEPGTDQWLPLIVDPQGRTLIAGSVSVLGTVTVSITAGASAIGSVGVSSLPPLPAGSNGIGSVIVSAMSALVASAARIGRVTLRNSADNADIEPLSEATFAARHPVVGQTLMAAAMPVVLPSNQSSIPVAATIAAALPAGGNAIGTVSITSLPALVLAASAAAIGKLAANAGVNIGTVDVASMPALGAGTNLLGKVGIDQTTPGTTNRVDIGTALPAGANAIGKLAANAGINIGTVDIATMPAGTSGGTVTMLIVGNLPTGGPYSAGDYVGPTATPGFAVNPANRATGLGGHIESFIMYDGDAQGVPCDIYFFENSNWTPPSDNAPWSLSDTSTEYNVGRCAINSYVPFGAGMMVGYGVFEEGPIPYKCNGSTLYFALVPRNPVTYTATRTTTTGLQFRIGFVPD